MKLSDVKGDRALEVIADLIDPIANIAEDEDAASLFKGEPAKDGEDGQKLFIARMRKAVPSLLKTHKDDVVAILSTIKGVSAQEYSKNMTMATVIGDVFELITDKEFLAFLASANNEK